MSEEVRIHKEKKGGHQCKYAEYTVKRPEGQIVNEKLYSGRVVVPSCLISILVEQDRHWLASEVHLMSNKGGNRLVASL